MGTFTTGEIIRQASVLLQDAGAVRWTYPELLDHLNAAIRATVALKPNCITDTVVLPLAKGIIQNLGANQTMLCRVIGNNAHAVAPMVPSTPIRMLRSREVLDTMIPGWMSPSTLPFTSVGIQYVIYDLAEPRSFFCAPGVDTAAGGVSIVVTVGIQPTDLVAPVNPLDPASYTAVVTLDSQYFNILLDFMLYRALTKDGALPGAAQRAAAHKQLFDDAMKGIITGEMAMNVNTYIGSVP